MDLNISCLLVGRGWDSEAIHDKRGAVRKFGSSFNNAQRTEKFKMYSAPIITSKVKFKFVICGGVCAVFYFANYVIELL
jgi:hypothetical protein